MGYHYPHLIAAEDSCRVADIAGGIYGPDGVQDGVIDLQDFAWITDRWLYSNCTEEFLRCKPGHGICLSTPVKFAS